MHAEALPPQRQPEEKWGLPIALALGVHLLLALVFIGAWLWSPQRTTEAAAGDPAIEASLQLSASEAAAARQALRRAFHDGPHWQAAAVAENNGLAPLYPSGS